MKLKLISLSVVGILLGMGFTSTTEAQITRTRTGPQGRSATTNREVQEGGVTRTRTGPQGRSATTTREVNR